MKYTYEQLAKMIDHSLLHPTLTDAELEEGCKLAVKYGVASVCVKPYAVKRAAELLRGTGVLAGCVIGFPHGNSATEAKRCETELACQDGAVEIDMVINIGKAMSGDWDYVERDIRAAARKSKSSSRTITWPKAAPALPAAISNASFARSVSGRAPIGSRLPPATVSSKAPTENTAIKVRPRTT